MNFDRFLSEALRKGVPLPSFGPESIAIVSDKEPREDFPRVSDSSLLLVSTKARAVMEDVAPGDCQFLPLDIKHEGKVIDSSYSVVNCLHRLDCIDKARSAEWLTISEPRIYIRVVIDPARVPSEISIFRVEGHSRSVFMREPVRLAFKKAKLTGWTAWQG